MKTKLLNPIARLLLAILMCLPICGSRLSAQEPYAVYNEATSTLTFKYGTKPAGAYSLNVGRNTPGWYKPSNVEEDYEYNGNIIKKVVFDASFAKARPTSCYKWFDGCIYLTTIEDIEYLNTENVTNMGCMFKSSYKLTTLDVSNFDTQNVTDMSNMFKYCHGLTTLDVSNLDTKNVTDMSNMFRYCNSLTTLDVSNLDTKNVTDMSSMFERCSALTTLDVSNFNTKNVTNMSLMFFDCYKLTTLDVSSFDTKNVTNMNHMFSDCSALTTLDVSKFDTQNVTDTRYMFNYCKTLTTLDVSNFDTQNVTDMRGMFQNCSALTTLDVSKFDTKNVTKIGWMFNGCSDLTTIYASDKFVTTSCEEDKDMFAGCANLVGAVPYDKSKIGKEMANYATGYFTYKAPTETYAMFDEATNTLTFKHDSNKPDGAFALNDGKNLPNWYRTDSYGNNSLSIEKVVFDASFANARPTSCYGWFYRCKDLTIIEGIEYLNTQNVTNMGFMFYDCSALKSLDLSSFDTKNVTNMQSMFNGCSALTTIYASDKFVTTAYKEDYNMFKGCSHLVGAVPYDENKVGKEMANYTTGYFTYKAATGIDAPTMSDDTAAEYYDLQGRRLNAPQKGVNIVKRGKKTTKMLVK